MSVLRFGRLRIEWSRVEDARKEGRVAVEGARRDKGWNLQAREKRPIRVGESSMAIVLRMKWLKKSMRLAR